ncbi:hypothetical protein PMAYCL1PPCAC_09394 [Pristionchus mayeri]|uniref:Uncharacterized protein n=1 Tax=Pristionchus mayeri TaxID=1317129 RepID=A0AAN5CDY2_9BILA|nr:hypothetical protein PMAYCL1PPCAC_09394 [Pristionchus mayeri]
MLFSHCSTGRENASTTLAPLPGKGLSSDILPWLIVVSVIAVVVLIFVPFGVVAWAWFDLKKNQLPPKCKQQAAAAALVLEETELNNEE